MKYIETVGTNLKVPNIALGVMRMPSLSQEEANRLVDEAVNLGINFFDTADIYGAGESDVFLGKAIKNHNREDLIIQTKASIISGRMYDASKENIVGSLNASLERLGTDYVDILLLHRPDALIEVGDVAEAFTKLYEEGKVKHFGVSNFNTYQIELLNHFLPKQIQVKFNQMQFGLGHSNMIDAGINVNRSSVHPVVGDAGILEYSQIHGINLQAWSPMQASDMNGVFIDNPRYPDLNLVLEELSEKYDTNKNAISIAWILRHPAKFQVILGTTNRERLIASAEGSEIVLEREDWYKLYMASGKRLP